MDVRGTLYCNECWLMIGEQKHETFEEGDGGKPAHIHNRFSGDCYSKWVQKKANQAGRRQISTAAT